MRMVCLVHRGVVRDLGEQAPRFILITIHNTHPKRAGWELEDDLIQVF